ncbi:hypothetical protein ACPPVT_07560 [Angustibacter sp. McL0619]|uniref:hypothetical protein n=1 Tax=Angustibacter sp. McL0619 TaxID=3415676 RepID=UPI003CEF3E61
MPKRGWTKDELDPVDFISTTTGKTYPGQQGRGDGHAVQDEASMTAVCGEEVVLLGAEFGEHEYPGCENCARVLDV